MAQYFEEYQTRYSFTKKKTTIFSSHLLKLYQIMKGTKSLWVFIQNQNSQKDMFHLHQANQSTA